LGKRYAGSRVRREDLLGRAGEGDEDQEGTVGGENSRTAEDPFAPVDEGSEDDPFAKGSSGSSESEFTHPDSSHRQGRKKMRRVSFSVSEDEDEEIHSDEAFGEEDDQTFESFKFLGSRSKKRTLDGSSEDGDVTDISDSDERTDNLQATNGTGLSVSESESEAESQEASEDGSTKDVNFLNGSTSEASCDVSDSDPSMKKATKRPIANDDRATLKALLSSDTAAFASSLSAAASADAKKGRAVKAQYQTFDRLLDARIKLQKGLTAANLMLPEQDFPEHKDAAQAAEEAALKLWNTITSLRHSFTETQSPRPHSDNDRKRKRPPPQATASTPISTLWSTTQSLNSTTLAHHRTILNKWSARVRASNPSTTTTESRSRLLNNHNNSSGSHNSITHVIDTYLATESSKLIAQSTTPTPNNPTNTSDRESKDTEHPNPLPHPPPISHSTTPTTPLSYNDAPFYQSLLRDLISSRQSTSTTNTLLPHSPHSLLPTMTTTRLHPPGSKNKLVDTKASKGRKVRYTVHERLQNFMAAQGEAGGGAGGMWSGEARYEFFGSLMGGRQKGRNRSRALDEESSGEEEEEEEEEAVRRYGHGHGDENGDGDIERS
jgi:protein AATF/BFR2